MLELISSELISQVINYDQNYVVTGLSYDPVQCYNRATHKAFDSGNSGFG